MKILLLGKVKRSGSHCGWKMAVRKQPEVTPEATVYADAAQSSCIVLLKQGKLQGSWLGATHLPSNLQCCLNVQHPARAGAGCSLLGERKLHPGPLEPVQVVINTSRADRGVFIDG